MTTPDLDDLITRAIAATDASVARSREEGSPDPAALGLTDSITGRGHAWEHRIEITMTDGRLTACELPPQALRLGADELAEHVITAANLAILDYQARLTAALTDQQPDLAGLSGSLREIQADAVRLVGAYTDQMYAVLRSVRDR